MKNYIVKSTILVGMVIFAIGILGCKNMENNTSDSSKVTVDISGLTKNLATNSSSSQGSSESPQLSSPDNDAQTAVQTLVIVPLTHAIHGEAYNIEKFDEAADEDFGEDAVNSANYLQVIQLPTSATTVEIEVPNISDGWQLLAAATVEEVVSAEEVGDATLAYIGFTADSYDSADDFGDSDTTLTMVRHCDQDDADMPKGCATFDGDKEAIATSAVEIHQIDINGTDQGDGGNAFPWIVRASPGGGEINVTTAETYMDNIVTSYVGTVNSITVYATHQMSDAAQARTGCTASTSSANIIAKCTEDGEAQEYARTY